MSNSKVITINLPKLHLQCLRVMEEEGHIRSRSDGIRKALSRFLDEECLLREELEDLRDGGKEENGDER